MTWSFTIGRLMGSELKVHATFFLLLAWIGAAGWLQGGPAAALVSVLFVLALFACVVLHEYGHALMARRFGIQTPDITLLPIGGLARLEKMPEDPRQEIAVAVAGPLVNVGIWALLLLLGAETDVEALAQLEDPAEGFWGRLAAVNLFLVLFNMIPAFPMDGGRVLRAALAMPLGRAQATRIASRAGQAVAFGFGFLGLIGGSPILMLIAIFVFLAAGAEGAHVALQEAVRDLPARAAMITSFDSLAPDETMQAAANGLLRSTQAEFPVLEEGRLVGMLTRDAIFAAVREQRMRRPVAEAMERDIPALTLTAPLETALAALYEQGRPAVAVTDREGRMLGYITRENVGELMVVRGA